MQISISIFFSILCLIGFFNSNAEIGTCNRQLCVHNLTRLRLEP